MTHYKPNEQLSFVKIQEESNTGGGDKFLSNRPVAMTAHQQLIFQAKQLKKSNSLVALRSISGLLKEEISDKELNEMLKDAHR